MAEGYPEQLSPMSFRSLLLLVLLGLVFGTSLTVLLIVRTGGQKALSGLMESQIETSLDAITAQVEGFFQPADRILNFMGSAMLHNPVLLEDAPRFGTLQADILRFEKGISYLGYGDAAGNFQGVWRNDRGDLIFNTSSPEAGSAREWIVREDGTMEVHPFEGPDVFDPRERPWYLEALESKGISWTDPYDFVDGDRGITAAMAWPFYSGEQARGVLMVDFTLTEISGFLTGLARHYEGDAFVISFLGELIATPTGWSEPIIEKALKETLAGLSEEEREKLGSQSVIRSFSDQGEVYFIGIQTASVPGNLNCLSAVIVKRSYAFGWVNHLVSRTALATAAALVLSLVIGYFFASRISRPLQQIAGEVEEIGEFVLDSPPPPASKIREVVLLQNAVEGLRRSLRSFSRVAPVELVRGIIQRGEEARLGGASREITVAFCDLEGFTSQAECLSPMETVSNLSHYFEAVSHAVSREHGTIDKFIGDAVMALFNAPNDLPGHPAAACRAALASVQALQNQKQGAFTYRIRFGIHTGEAIVGNTGTADRFNYTAIGDSVNLASRLEGLNKYFGTTILVSEEVQKQSPDFVWRLVDRVRVAGRAAPLLIYELFSLHEHPAWLQLYETSLARYWEGDFAQAEELIRQTLSQAPHDGPAKFLLSRIVAQKNKPPGQEWTGVFDFKSK